MFLFSLFFCFCTVQRATGCRHTIMWSVPSNISHQQLINYTLILRPVHVEFHCSWHCLVVPAIHSPRAGTTMFSWGTTNWGVVLTLNSVTLYSGILVINVDQIPKLNFLTIKVWQSYTHLIWDSFVLHETYILTHLQHWLEPPHLHELL